jgi:hypothetical protein
MDGLATNDTDDVSSVRDETNPLSDQHLGIPSADRRDVHKAVVIDVLHDDADLIDVSVDEDRRLAVGIDLRVAVPGDVDRDIVRELLRLRAPAPSGERLEARGSWRIEEALEKRDGFWSQHFNRLYAET